MQKQHLSFAAAIIAASAFVGCAEQPAPTTSSPPASPTTPAAPDHGHSHSGHGAGPHDGTVADWGGGKFHVEFTVDHDKQEATVYVLGDDEKTPAPVAAKDGKLLLTIKEPAFQVELTASPQTGDPENTASRFVGTHESLGKVQEFAGTISGEIDGTPYAGDFKEEPHGEHDHKK
jgi:hypothetical protein